MRYLEFLLSRLLPCVLPFASPVVAVASWSSATAASAKGRPNILLVLAEDLGPDLGCYGKSEATTPALDAFATEAVRYTACFTTAPICSPSRSALMTGRYQTTIGAQAHRELRPKPLPAGVATLTESLRAAGYYTVNINEPGAEPGPTLDRGCGKNDFNFLVERPYDGATWAECAASQPFFAEITIMDSHKSGWGWAHPEAATKRVDPATIKLPAYFPDHPVARAEYAAYLDAINVMDQSFAAILARLQREGLAENTIVIFMGDNGACLFRSKQFLYDGGLRVPLLIRWPDGRRAGVVDDRLVSGIDLPAAILALAGGDPIAVGMHGRDFLAENAVARDCVFAARDRAGFSIERMRSARTARFNYIRNYLPSVPYMQPNLYKEYEYPTWDLLKELAVQGKLTPEQARFAAPMKPAEELYDLQTDPDEVHNLARDPTMADILAEMRGRLERWLEEYGDDGAVIEDPLEIIKANQGYMKYLGAPNPW